MTYILESDINGCDGSEADDVKEAIKTNWDEELQHDVGCKRCLLHHHRT
jgi:hypothetical protein